jgi:hypothetical protein
LAKHSKKEIYWLKGIIPCSLEARGFAFLGWPNGNEETLLRPQDFSIKDGSEIRFWEDKWLGTTSLREQYPALYNIVRHKGDTIAKILDFSSECVVQKRFVWSAACFLECLTTKVGKYPINKWDHHIYLHRNNTRQVH